MVSYEVRFFFCQPGSECVANFVVPPEDVLGTLDFCYKPGDENLRSVAGILIEAGGEDCIARTRTESVVADVGLAKRSGGLGASHPQESVILFKPKLLSRKVVE